MNLVKALENKLILFETELNALTNDSANRDMCFTSCGCGNRATLRKLDSYRNKIGNYGDKIRALKLALRIAKGEIFIHSDILDIHRDFLQLRNPELYYDIYDRCSTFNAMKQVIILSINLFLPTYKKQVLKMGMKYDNENGRVFDVDLI